MAYVDVDTDVKHYTDPLEEKIYELEDKINDLNSRLYNLEKEAIERQDEEKFAIQQRDNFVNMMKIKREKDNA